MSENKKYIRELGNTFKAGHPNEIPWHPCFDYDNYHDYSDTKSTYHFDKWADDSEHPGVNLDLKFRGEAMNNVMNEVLPFVREQSRNAIKNDYAWASMSEWYHRMEIRGTDHVGYKEVVKPEKHPTLCKIVDWFELDEAQPLIMEKNVGNWETLHCDVMDGHPSGYGQKPLIRIIMHLQDWEMGQFAMWGTRLISQWRAGDCILYQPDMPHATANASRHRRYSLRITGVPSENTLTKLEKGGIINVDEL